MQKYQGRIHLGEEKRSRNGERKRRTEGTNEVIKEQKYKNKTSREQDSPSELRGQVFPSLWTRETRQDNSDTFQDDSRTL